jgi:hypothetical protein
VLVDGAGEYRVACGLVDRLALAGDGRLIDRRGASRHLAIQRDALARTHAQHGTQGHIGNGHFAPAGGCLNGGHLRRHGHQAFDGMASSASANSTMTIAASGHCPSSSAPVTATDIKALMFRFSWRRANQPLR